MTRLSSNGLPGAGVKELSPIWNSEFGFLEHHGLATLLESIHVQGQAWGLSEEVKR